MQANDYQKKTMETAIYPDAGFGSDIEIFYLSLGLTSEAGEIAGKVKKYIRDGKLDVGAVAYELGDVAWYLARLADAIGYELEDILQINYSKLTKRKEDGVIQGSGDYRTAATNSQSREQHAVGKPEAINGDKRGASCGATGCC
jgi:NTP pyrophosphatase (non-canonical NTP hydrolase)